MNVRGWLPAVFAAALLAGGCRFSGGTTEWPPEAVREIAFQTGYPERIRVLPLALDEEENVAPGEEFESAYPYRELAAALRRSPVELLLLPGDGRLFAVLPEEGGISPRFYRAEREAAGFEPEDSAVLVSEQEEGRFVPFFRIWSRRGFTVRGRVPTRRRNGRRRIRSKCRWHRSIGSEPNASESAGSLRRRSGFTSKAAAGRGWCSPGSCRRIRRCWRRSAG